VRLAVDLHRLANDVGVRAKMLPQPMGEDHYLLFAWLAFFGQEIAAKQDGCSQHPVVAWRGLHPVEVFGPVLGANNEIVGSTSVQFLEGGALLLPVSKIAR
jgi:hypothetical protein